MVQHSLGATLLPLAKQTFTVTKKGKQAAKTKTRFDWSLTLPNITLLVLNVFAIFYSYNHISSYVSNLAVYVNWFWIFYNIVTLVLSLIVSIEKSEDLDSILIPTAIDSAVIKPTGEKVEIVINELSMNEVVFVLKDKTNILAKDDLSILIDDEKNELIISERSDKRLFNCPKRFAKS